MMNTKLKIMFLIPTLSYGGAERVISVLASKCAENGHEISLIVLKKMPCEYEVSSRVNTYYLPHLETEAPILRYSKKITEVRSLVKTLSPDVIVPFLDNPSICAYLGSIGIDRVFVSAVRNNPQCDPPSRLKRDIMGFIYKHSDGVLFQNNEQRGLMNKPIKSYCVLPNPIKEDFLAQDYRCRSTPIANFVTVGRLDSQKNQKLMIEAFSEAHRHNNSLSLSIYGEGALFQELTDLIREKGLSSSVFLKGRIDNPETVLINYDAFILSSNYEGMPNALMEAMALGLPCISTACPTGPTELLGANERGLLTKLNDVDDLAHAILNCSASPEEARAKGTAARNYTLNNFTSEKVYKQFIKYCYTLIEAKK